MNRSDMIEALKAEAGISFNVQQEQKMVHIAFGLRWEAKHPIRAGFLLLVSILFFLQAQWADVFATDCQAARRMFEESTQLADAAARDHLLETAVAKCPTLAPALNDLALLREEAGQFDDAGDLYQKAIHADPEFVNGYAGLGDVRFAQKRYREAASAFQLFIELAEKQKAEGGPHQVAAYIPMYRTKLEAALTRARSSGLATADEIVRSLSMVATKQSEGASRGIRITPVKPRIALDINFEFGHHRLTKEARRQLEEVVLALKSRELQAADIRIEGHTDSIGDEAANLTLSRLRGDAVMAALVSAGIAEHRLKVKAYGESRPIADNETQSGRALNRRVSFVNDIGAE